ncbi:hypothetical protein HD597_005366 [Nonomuraea thailandensis]|uniref:Uncharacterized protein n=1 Tax=Nonomuraea thailandensis TaxID=1188745 RepID=A0A9X2K656_9ACTN|nr:hypothetical protein [Nonomuraea thailandensis]MCP2358346.1 hypothetical protein [Nonomuraea thailandensis]
MRRGRALVMAGLACAVLSLGVPAPAAAEQAELGDVQQVITTLAKTDGVVGAIGEVFVDGKRVGRGTAGSRLLVRQGRAHPLGFALPDRVADQAHGGHDGPATGRRRQAEGG